MGIVSLKIERTHDMEVINDILNHSKIRPHIVDDFSEDALATDVSNHYWLLVTEDKIPRGAFLLHPHNLICYEVHTCLLPEIWGDKSRLAGLEGFKWMLDNTNCQKIITNIPEYNKSAMRYAKSLGFIQEGINRKSLMRKGQTIDQYVLGITKEEFLCQLSHSLQQQRLL